MDFEKFKNDMLQEVQKTQPKKEDNNSVAMDFCNGFELKMVKNICKILEEYDKRKK